MRQKSTFTIIMCVFPVFRLCYGNDSFQRLNLATVLSFYRPGEFPCPIPLSLPTFWRRRRGNSSPVWWAKSNCGSQKGRNSDRLRRMSPESEDSPKHSRNTEPRKSLGTWLRDISSCSCLTFLPGPAWVLLSKIWQDFFSALYTNWRWSCFTVSLSLLSLGHFLLQSCRISNTLWVSARQTVSFRGGPTTYREL